MSPLWKIYLALSIVTATDGALNTVFSPFLDRLGYPLDWIGGMVALFGLTQLVARLPSGILYGKGKVRPLLIGLLLVYSLSVVAFAYPGGLLYLVFWTVVHGFAFGGIGTILLAWAIDLNPQGSSHAGAMGWYTAALSAGYSVGYFLGGYLGDRWGYALTFLVTGLLPLLSVLLILSIASPRAAESRRAGSVSPSRRTPGSLRSAWMQALSPNLMLATLIAFFMNFLLNGTSPFFTLYGLDIGLSLTFIGLLKSMLSFTATGLRPFSGVIFRYLPIRPVSNALLVLWAGGVMLIPNLRQPWMLVVLFVTIGVCRGLTRVTSATMIAEERSRNAEGIGVASGLYNAGLDVGSFLGPIVAGGIAAVTGIELMFRIAPLLVLAVFVAATFAITRQEARQLRQEQTFP